MKRNDTFRIDRDCTVLPSANFSPQPSMIEIVKLLARIAAQRDYIDYLKSKE